MTRSYIFWILLYMLPYVAGEYLSKKFASEHTAAAAVGALVCYGLCSASWLLALTQRNSLIVVGTTLILATSVIGVLMGRFMFNEQISSTGVVGVVFAVVAMVLLTIS